MILVLSDLHLADTKERRTINIEALCDLIARTADHHLRADGDELNVLLLGDVFEILKSSVWIDRNLRPWDTHTADHHDAVTAIFERIKDANWPLFEKWSALTAAYPGLKCTYVPGNHDWPLNAPIGRAARRSMVELLRLQHDHEVEFPLVYLDVDHGLLATHGHEHDPFNRTEVGRIAFGDAVVIEVLLMLPRVAARELGGWSEFDPRLAFLHELDNVRPQSGTAMAAWIANGAKSLESEVEGAEKAIHRAVATVVAEMRTLRKRRQVTGAWKPGDKWVSALAKVTNVAIDRLRLVRWVAGRTPDGDMDSYTDAAKIALASVAGNPEGFSPEFFVCGHTHLPEHETVMQPDPGLEVPALYLNTGTWRRVQRHVADAKKRRVFSTHDEESYVVLYSKRERAAGAPRYEFRRIARG